MEFATELENDQNPRRIGHTAWWCSGRVAIHTEQGGGKSTNLKSYVIKKSQNSGCFLHIQKLKSQCTMAFKQMLPLDPVSMFNLIHATYHLLATPLNTPHAKNKNKGRASLHQFISIWGI